VRLLRLDLFAAYTRSDAVMRPDYHRESEGICFHRRWFVCVCVCLSVTTITKEIVDVFAPNFMRRFLGEKGRPSLRFVTIGRRVWK